MKMNKSNMTGRKSGRKLLCLTMIMMLCMGLLLSGCGPTKSLDKKEMLAKLYYVNDEYVATGNEELNEMQPAYEKSLEVTEEEKYVAVLEALKVVPAEGYDTLMSNKFTVNNVTVDGNQAVVDFSSQDLDGGSLEETLLIHQVVLSLVDTFKVQTVAFTLDGETVGSLMGHVDTSTPFCVMVDQSGRDVVVPVSDGASDGNADSGDQNKASDENPDNSLEKEQ